MKKLLFFVVVLTALAAPLANAQVHISPWDSGAVQYRAFWLANNVGQCGGFCSPGPGNPSGFPVIGAAGYGYPGVGAGRSAAVISGAMAGASIGAIAGGSARWAGVGAVAGGLGAWAMTRNQVRHGQLDCGKPKLSREERETCAELRHQAEAEQQAAAAQAAAQERAVNSVRWLHNRSGQQAFIFDGATQITSERPFMLANESWRVDRPATGQWTAILRVPKGSGVVDLPAIVRSVGYEGWEIVAAEVR